MKTLKEIHKAQGEKFGYKVKTENGEPLKVIGYDSEDDIFFLREKKLCAADWSHSSATIFTLIEEPQEIWVNTHELPTGLQYYIYHASAELAADAGIHHAGFVRTTKFREVENY